jgi:hypothetical protein
VLPTDRTHQVKLQAIYDATFGLSLGANWFWRAASRSRARRLHRGQQLPDLLRGPQQRRRTDFFNQLDIFAQYEFKLGSGQQARCSETPT